MIAGTETSTTSLAWTLYELARHQACQDKLREELAHLPDEIPMSVNVPFHSDTDFDL